ncbi:hypothetical protein [Pelagibacterium mangrovi]|uniref:hypothetical protein n=1 Tax=Pelagibacterium mangrovi TaxID=3119828 RepID=UPI002FC6FD9D
MTDTKQPIDWAGIEKDYRGSTRSIREIAAWFSISEGAIRKRAKKDGWERPAKDSGAQVVRADANADPVGSKPVPKIEEVIGRGRNIADRLLDELDAETLQRGELETIIMMSEEDPARQTALKQAVSLPVRAKTLQTLALALKTMGETAAAGGKKQQRQVAAEDAAKSGSKFAPRTGPRLAVNNS